METRSKHGYPACPADEVMRRNAGARQSRRAWADQCDTAWGDPLHPRPPRGCVMGFAVALILVAALSLVTACGGEVSAKVNPTADRKVEITWERQVKAVCDLPVAARVEAMNQVNNALLDQAFVLFACPGTDPLNTDAKPILYNGTPALAVQVQVIYLLPGMGEQANPRSLHSLQLGESLRGVGATNTP